jgi:hypothetical protein
MIFCKIHIGLGLKKKSDHEYAIPTPTSCHRLKSKLTPVAKIYFTPADTRKLRFRDGNPLYPYCPPSARAREHSYLMHNSVRRAPYRSGGAKKSAARTWESRYRVYVFVTFRVRGLGGSPDRADLFFVHAAAELLLLRYPPGV